jgi:polysaccharide biosynthesis/export protein
MMGAMSLGLLLAATLQAAPPPLPPSAGPDAAEEARAPETASPDYRIGPEDVVRIAVYGHPDLAQTVVVRGDGTFVYPLVGRVEALDLTAPELERKLADLLSQGFIRNPQVSAAIQEYRSRIVFVVGAVARPGPYPLLGTRRLVEVLAKAGPSTSDAGTEVLVVRPPAPSARPLLPEDVSGAAGSAAVAEVIRVNIRDIEAGDLAKNIVLLPGDTVFIPTVPRVFVAGRVESPGGYPFVPGTTVRQVVTLAGGATRSRGGIRVVREIDGRTRTLKVDLEDLVRPGDTIVVGGRPF